MDPPTQKTNADEKIKEDKKDKVDVDSGLQGREDIFSAAGAERIALVTSAANPPIIPVPSADTIANYDASLPHISKALVAQGCNSYCLFLKCFDSLWRIAVVVEDMSKMQLDGASLPGVTLPVEFFEGKFILTSAFLKRPLDGVLEGKISSSLCSETLPEMIATVGGFFVGQDGTQYAVSVGHFLWIRPADAKQTPITPDTPREIMTPSKGLISRSIEIWRQTCTTTTNLALVEEAKQTMVELRRLGTSQEKLGITKAAEWREYTKDGEKRYLDLSIIELVNGKEGDNIFPDDRGDFFEAGVIGLTGLRKANDQEEVCGWGVETKPIKGYIEPMADITIEHFGRGFRSRSINHRAGYVKQGDSGSFLYTNDGNFVAMSWGGVVAKNQQHEFQSSTFFDAEDVVDMGSKMVGKVLKPKLFEFGMKTEKEKRLENVMQTDAPKSAEEGGSEGFEYGSVIDDDA